MPERKIDLGSKLLALSGVLLITTFSLLIDVPFRFSLLKQYIESPFVTEEGASGALMNSLIFFSLVLIGTLVFILIIKLRKIRMLPLIFSISIFFSFFVILELFLSALSEYIVLLEPLVDIISFTVSLVTAYLVYSPRYPLFLNGLLLIYGSMSGALFSELLPVWSIFTIAFVMSFYDLYAVFKGPLKYILENVFRPTQHQGDIRENVLRGASVQLGKITLGMGDVLMYSMLSPTFYFFPYPSFSKWLFSIIGLLLGFFLTLKLLEKKKFMPALPMPVFCSTLFFMFSWMVLRI